MPAAITVGVGPWRIVAYVNEETLAEQLRHEWQHLVCDEAGTARRNTPAATTLRIHSRAGEVGIHRTAAAAVTVPRGLAARGFAVTMNAVVRELSRRDRLTPLHAGACLTERGAIVVPGTTRAGKSTLVYALSQLGSPAITDEHLILDHGDVPAVAYGKPVTLRRSASELFDGLAQTLGTARSVNIPVPTTSRQTPLEQTLVAWIDRDAHAPGPVAPHLALAWLLCTTAFDDVGFRDFGVLAGVAGRARHVRYPRRAPAELARELRDAAAGAGAEGGAAPDAADVSASRVAGVGTVFQADFTAGSTVYEPGTSRIHVLDVDYERHPSDGEDRRIGRLQLTLGEVGQEAPRP